MRWCKIKKYLNQPMFYGEIGYDPEYYPQTPRYVYFIFLTVWITIGIIACIMSASEVCHFNGE